jgi:hypothetical protein
MHRIARACVALMLASVACGDDGDANPTEPSPQASPMETANSPVVQDAGSTPAPSSPPDVATVIDAGAPALDSGSVASPDTGSKPDAARPPLVLEIPKATVMCGTSACDTLANVCCESWSNGRGFGTTRSCVTRDKCYDMYERAGDVNRAITHECDGKEDCSGGQVCCMIAEGAPLCAFEDLAMCTSKIYGPGGSGMCADNALCMLGNIQFIAEGVPMGVLACNDDSDCADRKGTSCQAEQDGSITTGKGIKARPYVKVCR